MVFYTICNRDVTVILNTYKIPYNCIFFYVSPEHFSGILIKCVIKSSVHHLFVHSGVARVKVTMKLPVMYLLGTVLLVVFIS